MNWKEWNGSKGRYDAPSDYDGGAIKYRCGEINKTLTNFFVDENGRRQSAEWRHDGEGYDIIAYVTADDELTTLRAFRDRAIARYPDLATETDAEAAERIGGEVMGHPASVAFAAIAWARANPR